MSETANDPDLWNSATPVDRAVSASDFTVDVDGYEGPLDLLLALARTQKVDLAKISILQLAIQYLEFVDKARKLRLELAADYLVMAAWLAFLKSRLLLPEAEVEDEPSGEDLANQLAFRLRRLEAMRDASVRLMNRNRLGRDVFGRGNPEPVIVNREQRYNATLYDLLSAYASQKQRQTVSTVTIAHRQMWSLTEAREILARLIGDLADWTPMDVFLSRYLDDGSDRRGVIASTFAASLEMVREGKVEVQQSANFEPLYMRRPKPTITDTLTQPA
ncbi:MAG: ScpA family protein [Pseudomonadota bacterium]